MKIVPTFAVYYFTNTLRYGYSNYSRSRYSTRSNSTD